MAHQIVVRASERNAADIKLLDIRELTTIADFFVICTATSTVHVRALVDEVVNAMREDADRRGRPEGSPSDGWMVVDFGDVLVHVFVEEKRTYYALEEFWADAPALVHMP
ncbi:MAG: ribosome silencing factor [Chloroflexota bacterium]|nr:ribosome silencing factor [Chloroflexota bacterium]MDP6509434.1 ribosome silencing factor [Chloroflexota bacterium]MDP6758488.1 ribosome silencing factor [Chloroflexota bacterium]